MSDSKKPAATITYFPVACAIWRNVNQKNEVFYSVSFEKKYRDAAGEPRSSSTFSSGDLLLLAKLADAAESKIRDLRASDRAAQQADDQAA